jgi:multidrug resistance efflux pump
MENEKPENINNINIRSEEIDEILGRSPNWIVRRGITSVALVFLLLLFGSWFFRYPDKINSTIVVTSSNIPANIISKTSARIAKIFVADKQEVDEGDIIALLENTAVYTNVLEVSLKLDSLKKFIGNYQTAVECDFSGNYTLGDLQSYFSTFRNNYNEYLDFIASDYYTSKASLLQQRIMQYNSVYKKLGEQEDISKMEYDLSSKQFARDSSLYRQEVIPQSEFDKTKGALLQDKYNWLTSGTSIDNAMIEAGVTGQTLLELKKEYNDKKKEYEQALSLSYDNLVAQLKLWEQSFLLKAPVSGQVTFAKFWSENQNVVAGDKICTIVPEGESNVSARVTLPIAGSGKVKEGQKVNMKFDNYPYMEYGTVTGTVKAISLVPADDTYTVEVDLPEGLQTSYGKKLAYKPEMKGTAEIITEDLRLIERLVMPLKYLLEK